MELLAGEPTYDVTLKGALIQDLVPSFSSLSTSPHAVALLHDAVNLNHSMCGPILTADVPPASSWCRGQSPTRASTSTSATCTGTGDIDGPRLPPPPGSLAHPPRLASLQLPRRVLEQSPANGAPPPRGHHTPHRSTAAAESATRCVLCFLSTTRVPCQTWHAGILPAGASAQSVPCRRWQETLLSTAYALHSLLRLLLC